MIVTGAFEACFGVGRVPLLCAWTAVVLDVRGCVTSMALRTYAFHPESHSLQVVQWKTNATLSYDTVVTFVNVTEVTNTTVIEKQ